MPISIQLENYFAKILMIFGLMSAPISSIYCNELRHYFLADIDKADGVFVWEEKTISPFDELIVSWDAKRPEQGAYLIQVSLLTTEWSPWLDYAFWGVQDQYTFKYSPGLNLQVYQDAVEVLEGNKAWGFRVRVLASQGASLKSFRALHACATDRTRHRIDLMVDENRSIHLDFPGLSQMALLDERRRRICSPTSTTAVIRFLLQRADLSPIEFANQVVDSAFDIYGNWILNTAQASHELGEPWHCCVARLISFNQILDQLSQGYPVIISVKGSVNGGALPYDSGHLLVIKGYNADKRTVLCMDPAFATDELTDVQYLLDDFLLAWSRRQGLAYLFYAINPLQFDSFSK